MPRRPLLHVTVFFVLPIIVIEIWSLKHAFCILMLLTAFRILRNDDRAEKTAAIWIIAFILGCGNLVIHDAAAEHMNCFTEQKAAFQGKVISCTIDSDSSLTAVVRVKGHGKILVKEYECMDTQIAPGDLVRFEGTAENAQGRRNPACFDYAGYLQSKGIRATVTVNELIIIEAGSEWIRSLYSYKENFMAKVEKYTGENAAAMIRGILFGDKSRLDDETLEEFQKNGTAHILAVSGLHVGIIYAFICFLWPWCRGKAFVIFTGAFLGVYSVLASFSVSVIRASMMIMLHLIAGRMNRRYDLSSAAFAVVLIMTIQNPRCIYDPGMQMSFLAVLTMSLLLPYVKKVHDGILSGSIAVQAGLMPYIMYNFNCLPVGALLVNVPVIMITGVLVPLGLISMAAGALNESLFTVAAWLLGLICGWLNRFNSLTCIEGITTFNVNSPPEFFMALFYLTMLLIMSEEGRIKVMRKGMKYLCCTAVVILIISSAFDVAMRTGFEKTDITFVDVGQGDCIHIRTDRGSNYLIDGGGKEGYDVGMKILKPYLLKNGVSRVDGAFVTHLHKDHYDGILRLCREGLVEKLFIYESNIVDLEAVMDETGMKRNQIVFLYGSMNVKLSDKCSIEVLAPARKKYSDYVEISGDKESENKSSLILMADIDGVRTLVTGDADLEYERELVSQWGARLDSDILKVSHHGSRFGSCDELLRAATPYYSVIQVGRNSFGHPSSETLQRLGEHQTEIYRNDENGAVGIEIENGEIVNIVTAIK